MSTNKAIAIRQNKLRQALLDQLKRTPVIELACEKAGVGRATYYRWIKDSKKFGKDAEMAIWEGRLFISDIAESQLFSLIRDKKIEAIKYWLSNHNPRYGNKLELSGMVTTRDEPLTKEQKQFIKKALRLSSLDAYKNTNQKNKPQ